MKRYISFVALALALGLGYASAQNITRSLQGSQDPRGPVGWDTSNAMYFPGHINSTGPVSPSVSVCGNSGAAVAGTDNAGVISVGNSNGGTGGTSCTVTFAAPFNVNPACVVAVQKNGSTSAGGSGTAVTSPVVWSVSTTAITLSTVPSGATLSYICMAVQ